MKLGGTLLVFGGAVAASLSGACTDRTGVSSEVGRQVAERLCPVQSNCSCGEHFDDYQPFPRCEDELEHEIGQHEREALDHGLEFSAECLAMFLDDIDRFSACGSEIAWRPEACPVYSGAADVGEACELFEFFPVMTNCRPGLVCRQGFCHNIDSPPLLDEGEICSEMQGNVPSGFLGMCREGLFCDSRDTLRCMPYIDSPKEPLGSECAAWSVCEDGTYCRPPEDADDVSEESPGTCTAPTPTGLPCAFVHECEEWLCEEGTCTRPPSQMCLVLRRWHLTRDSPS